MTILAWRKLGLKKETLEARFVPRRHNDGLSRCHVWIGAAKLPTWDLSRAPTNVWEQFFGHFAQKYEGFLKILESRTQVQVAFLQGWP